MHSEHLKTGWLWVLSGGLALAFGGAIEAAAPQTQEQKEVKVNGPAKDLLLPFTVSKETTRFTEPLKADGTVDFAAALNARLSQGITPDTNAGVPLMQAFGANVIPEEHREKFFKDLGIAVPAANGSLTNFGQFVEGRLNADGNEDEIEKVRARYNEQFSKALDGPWSRKDLPVVSAWLDANAEALKLAAVASQKPRLFLPVVRSEKDAILDINFELLDNMRVFSRLLTARTMLALEEGRIDDAQADLLAGHRLAVLVSHQPMMIHTLVSYALDAMACQGDQILAASGKATAEQLSAYRENFINLPPLARMGDIIDQGERFVSLDALCHMATNLDEETANTLGIPKAWRRVLGLSMDWDLIMKMFNQRYDEMASALRIDDHSEREAAIAKIDEDLKKLREEANQPAQFALMFLGVNPPRAAASRQMGNALLTLLIPAVRQAGSAETRTQNRRDMTLLTLALAEYERETGEYPKSLAELAPKYLKTIPGDQFSGNPLKYQHQDKGYLLYSVGPNGKDENGERGSANNPTADDWAIRVPREPEL